MFKIDDTKHPPYPKEKTRISAVPKSLATLTLLSLFSFTSSFGQEREIDPNNHQEKEAKDLSLDDSLLESGILKFELGDYKGAEQDFSGLLKKDPKNILALLYRSYAHLFQENAAASRNDHILACSIAAEKLDGSATFRDFENAALILQSSSQSPEEQVLLSNLQDCLLQPETQDEVLRACALYSIPQLDFTLASLLPRDREQYDRLSSQTKEHDQDVSKLDMLLGAVASSGKVACLRALQLMETKGLVEQNERCELNRSVYYQVMFALDQALALDEALRYYARHPSELDMDQSPMPLQSDFHGYSLPQTNGSQADVLSQMIEINCAKRSSALECIRALARFSAPFRYAPQENDSERYKTARQSSSYARLASQIQAVLVDLDTPLSLYHCLGFANSVLPSQASKALEQDYSALVRAPWLAADVSYYQSFFSDPVARTLQPYLAQDLPLPPRYVFREIEFFEDGLRQQKAPKVEEWQELTRTTNENTVQYCSNILAHLGELLDLDIDPSSLNFEDPVVGFELRFPLSAALAQSLRANDKNLLGSSNVAEFFVAKELGVTALQLYALAQLRRSETGLDESLSLDQLGDFFNELADQSLESSSFATSHLVDQLPESHSTPSQAILLLSSIDSDRDLKLNKRSIFFDPNSGETLYHETLQILTGPFEGQEVNWSGRVPSTVALALNRCPRILDLCRVSLAIRDIRARLLATNDHANIVDLLLSDPEVSIMFLQPDHGDIPLGCIEDSIQAALATRTRQDIYGSGATGLFERGLGYLVSPGSQHRGELGLDQSYNNKVNDVLNWRAQEHAWARIKKAVDQLDDKVWKSYTYTDRLPDGTSVQRHGMTRTDNPVKKKGLSKCRRGTDQARANLQALAEFDLNLLLRDPLQQISFVKGGLSLRGDSATSLYQLKTKGGQTRSFLVSSSPQLPDWVELCLAVNPKSMELLNQDYTQLSQAENTRLGQAVSLVANTFYGPEPVIRSYQLNGCDLSLVGMVRELRALIASSPESTELDLLGAEVQDLIDLLTPFVQTRSDKLWGTPPENLNQQLVTKWKESEQQALTEMDKAITPVLGDIEKARKKMNEFVIGFSITLTFPTPQISGLGIGIRYGPLDLNFSSNSNWTERKFGVRWHSIPVDSIASVVPRSVFGNKLPLRKSF